MGARIVLRIQASSLDLIQVIEKELEQRRYYKNTSYLNPEAIYTVHEHVQDQDHDDDQPSSP